MQVVAKSMFLSLGAFLLLSAGIVVPEAGALAAGPAATAGPKLVPHRAVYDMKLGESEEQAGIAGLTGRMVYDFSGNACDGYSVNFRFVTKFQDTNGGSQITDLQTTSFEEPHAGSYQFLSKTFVDRKLVEETRGTAHAGPDAKTVELKEPSEKSLRIGSDVLFPTEHLVAILKAADDNVHFVAADIYDGAETGEKVYATTTVIGAETVNELKAGAGKATAPLAGLSYWPVTVAYFDPSKEDASGELLPVYQLAFRLYQNGISSHLKLDYGDFTILGQMASLELYEEGDCPPN
ncbi:cell envelope integrity EipB family protein [Roseibium sp. Sym1]|uniref:cell envelope integrity EipB family protein n=1 Tax=Roseibium sp. Sym1 TaxID=3016006 RepID=UPI0022B5BAEB|nr:cell envelope integrity EipB family protein [Roseibium sp. Sym1]